MAVVTSKGTMDKQNYNARKYIAERAELVGAIRLPNTAFKQTAGTEAVADILFFKKREEFVSASIEDTEWLNIGKTEEGYEINQYFITHSEMVLGTLVKEKGLYGAEDVTVKADERELFKAIEEAVEQLPKDFYVNPETEQKETSDRIELDYDVKPMNLVAQNGQIYMRFGETMVEQTLPGYPKDAYERIEKMIALRVSLRRILELQVKGCLDEILEKEQRQLNLQYDRFVKKYGYLNSQTNSKLFKEDGDSALLFSCENISEDKQSATKADIFTKRTIRPYAVVTSTDDVFEALQISRNEHGCVDISYIEDITKKDYETVLKELGEAVFRNPVEVNAEDKYSGFETAEEYLSGRVVDKLRIAREYQQKYPNLIDYERNIKALEEVQPTPIKASDISVRIGTSWLSKDYYKDFFCETMRIPYYLQEGLEFYYSHNG